MEESYSLQTKDQRFQFGVQRAPTDILRNGEHYGCIRVPGKSSPYAHRSEREEMVVEKCQICRMQERVHESITERQKLTEEIRLRGRNISVIPRNHFVFEKVHRASRAK